MLPAEIANLGMYIALGAAAALSCVAAFGVLLHIENERRAVVVPAVFILLLLGIIVSAAMSGRNLTYAAVSIDLINATGGDGATWPLRFITLLILGLSVARVLGEVSRRRTRPNHEAFLLFAAFLVFFISNYVLNALFGDHPAFVHNVTYALPVFVAVFVARRETMTTSIVAVRNTLVLITVLSLLAALVKPELALEPHYKSWLPLVNERLWGLGSGPNSIGSLALVCLLVTYLEPFSNRWLHWAALAIAATVLVLAQSKTAWVAALVASTVVFAYRSKDNHRAWLQIGIFASFAVGLGLTVALFLEPTVLLRKMVNTPVGDNLATFTGRDQLWLIAIEEWKRNPLFGYGPEMWGGEFRQLVGLRFAFSAHNQFLQSLGGAGTIGVAGLAFYICVLARCAQRQARATKGLSLAIFCVVLLRCVTETPLVLGTLFNGDFFTHLVLFRLSLGGAAARETT